MDLKSKIILIYGPTASGKSKFALKIARKINGEIVNADSMQIYKELKILSARPNPKDYKNIKHHLYGFVSVKKNFSTGDWLKFANKKILEIRGKKKVPIIVGGTGLYFKALIDGLVELPKIPINFRGKIRFLHKKIGQKKFFMKLKKIDSLAASKIKPLDSQRTIRAYEIKSYTKKSIYKWFKDTKSSYENDEFYKIYIDFPKNDLIVRINRRTKKMLKIGAIQEVKKFISLKVLKNKTANKAIGISEIKEYLVKKIKIDNVIEKISIKTRQYAKRQRTWARGNMSNWNKMNLADLNKLLKKI